MSDLKIIQPWKGNSSPSKTRANNFEIYKNLNQRFGSGLMIGLPTSDLSQYRGLIVRRTSAFWNTRVNAYKIERNDYDLKPDEIALLLDKENLLKYGFSYRNNEVRIYTE